VNGAPMRVLMPLLARFQAEWRQVVRPESAPALELRAHSDAKPVSTFAERAGALSGRVDTGRPPGKRASFKLRAHSDAKPVSTFAERALLAAALLTLTGCTGDFGRPARLPIVNDIVIPPLAAESLSSPDGPVTFFPFTDDEKRLRDIGYQLLVPPYQGEVWRSLPVELSYGTVLSDGGPEYDRRTYGTRLLTLPRHSQAARYARLIDDIRNDMLRIDRFSAVAWRVSDLDRKREISLGHVTALTPIEHANAVRRVKENRRIMLIVNEHLVERAASYRYALERLVIAAPSEAAADADRALVALERRIAEIISIPGIAGLVAKG
jgi:hypothetical protein